METSPLVLLSTGRPGGHRMEMNSSEVQEKGLTEGGLRLTGPKTQQKRFSRIVVLPTPSVRQPLLETSDAGRKNLRPVIFGAILYGFFRSPINKGQPEGGATRKKSENRENAKSHLFVTFLPNSFCWAHSFCSKVGKKDNDNGRLNCGGVHVGNPPL